jgi:hypothetical protein
MKSAVGIVTLALATAIVALIISGVVRYEDDGLLLRMAAIDDALVPITTLPDLTTAISDQTQLAALASIPNVTLANSGTVRWYSNCQQGWRNAFPDSYAITNNAKTYSDLDGKPESAFFVWYHQLNNGMTQIEVELRPPLEPIQFTDADDVASCKVYVMASEPVWVEFLSSIEHNTFALRSIIASQNVMTLEPPCDGIVCDFLTWVSATFYCTPGFITPLEAKLSMTVYSDTYEWRHNEAVFVARNLTITDALKFPIML